MRTSPVVVSTCSARSSSWSILVRPYWTFSPCSARPSQHAVRIARGQSGPFRAGEATMEERPNFDLTDRECFITGEPYSLLRWLRQNAPLSRISDQQRNSYWAATKYADLVKIYRDPATFSSEGPIVMSI